MTTKEQVIELAKQAGYQHPDAVGDSEAFAYFNLEAYTRIVRKHYRDELLANHEEPLVNAKGYCAVFGASGMSLYSGPLHTGNQLAAAVLKACTAAREDAAKVCEEMSSSDENKDSWTITRFMAMRECAAAIRNMKDNT